MEARGSDDEADARAARHGMWASVAPGWAEHADYVDARSAALTDELLAVVRSGDRVLELACGPGGLGLAAAERVGAEGEVVLSDAAAPMTRIAAQRAESLGLTNVATRELELERIDEPESSYDVVLCREGLMFAADPAAAAAEVRRVLRPGGRAAFAVWGPREGNPWLGIMLDSVSAQIGVPVPPPGIPGPFSLADSARLEELLTGAGLAEVVVREQPVPMQSGSFDEWWTRTSALAGPLAKMLEAMPEVDAEAIRTRARAAAAPYETATGLEFPGVSLLATGSRA